VGAGRSGRERPPGLGSNHLGLDRSGKGAGARIFAAWLTEAIRPELYVKIAIGIIAAWRVVAALSCLSLTNSLLLRLVAIAEAYLMI
jgi:hypothetical protein